MARSRNIKPGYFTNDRLAELPALTRLLFAGLWTIADKAGRLEDRPKRIKALVLPYDNCDIDAALDELAGGPDPFIVRYEADGLRCIQVLAWERHQSPHHKEEESTLPCIDQATFMLDPSMSQARAEHDSERVHAPVKGIRNQVKGIKEEGIKADPLEGVRDETVRDSTADWLSYKRERRESYKPTALKSLVTRLNSLTDQHGAAAIVEAQQRAMAAGWKGFEHGLGDNSRGSPTPRLTRPTRGEEATQRFLARHKEASDGVGGSGGIQREQALRLEGPSG